jgi:putative nucleotidyltransferase with HDIG domain
MISMNKNKSRRGSNGRGIFEGRITSQKFKAVTEGTVVSLLMLGLFVIFSGLVLIFSRETISNIFQGQWSALRSWLVVTALMLVLSVALGLYVASCQPRIIQNNLRGGVLLISLLVMIAVVRAGVINGLSAYLVVVPVMIMAIMMTIAYSQRFALGISSFLALVSVLSLRENPEMFEQSLGVLLATGCGVGIAVLCLKEIRTRSRLIEVSTLAGIVVFVMVWLVGWWQELPYKEILADSFWAAGGSVSVGFIMQGLLPFFERIFRTATSLTLLDYSEATNPLRKRLAVEAPGTFNHSLQIGILAEAAAEMIGANGLLCRVGSYYHDVGKLNKPRYFVENQGERLNQHKELTPAMSRMIIIGHVRDGLELAREYRIPRVLHQFIATHHGTTVVEYFYHEATKTAGESGSKISETEFRYPGPKPSTREAAIVMMTDAVESATRALKDPTPNRIEDVVHQVAMKRLQDGQFEECELTMRELRLIEDSLVRSLCGMYHGRIAYPKQKKREKNVEHLSAGQRVNE